MNLNVKKSLFSKGMGFLFLKVAYLMVFGHESRTPDTELEE